jgi:predicted CXXCH cytochrome family protein
MAARALLHRSLAAAALALAGLMATAQQAPAPGVGDKCVAPTDWMRRYHMTALRHQRDETVHEGARDTRFSLEGCISCHAVKDTAGVSVTADDPQHFCRTCHDYAAVKPDCFQCHASRPGEGLLQGGTAQLGTGGLLPISGAISVAALETYLREARP